MKNKIVLIVAVLFLALITVVVFVGVERLSSEIESVDTNAGANIGNTTPSEDESESDQTQEENQGEKVRDYVLVDYSMNSMDTATVHLEKGVEYHVIYNGEDVGSGTWVADSWEFNYQDLALYWAGDVLECMTDDAVITIYYEYYLT